MGMFRRFLSRAKPLSNRQIKSTQKRVGRIAIRMTNVEEDIEVVQKELTKEKDPRKKLGLQAKLKGLTATLAHLEMQEHAYGVQLTNGLNAQFTTLGRELADFENFVLDVNRDLQPLINSTNLIKQKLDPKASLRDIQRVQSILGLAITADKQAILQDAGRNAKNAAAAESIIDQDIKRFTDTLGVLGTTQQQMQRLRRKFEIAERKYEAVNTHIFRLLDELKAVGHDYLPKQAAVHAIGGSYRPLKFSAGFAQK
jgi:hypothetical protein